ncbi:RHS repeat-associated core domain-containing protein [Chryseobacterium ureilyticum]|uniref:RHS repeat-associated core domain-containing protein n=1 Tax=Chryseobacterium ureilyticum TaxID=373668 RepID=A0A1N7QK38_9FLAO|nr:RHS repeat-associated core domain-containing protein [Chryseobacterium ureilyticum]SIT22867.1 RHS repeat-associated core domain-containing protein [Chryseobacterium ureilyticum]
MKNQYIYQYKDHLGNVRISFGRTSAGALEITDANDYYPFGMNHLKTGNAFFGQGNYKNYKYQGQELQETGFYSFKWRNYMPDVGRFFNIDPLADKYRKWSPYTFSGNIVINAREIEGLEPYVLFGSIDAAAENFGQ